MSPNSSRIAVHTEPSKSDRVTNLTFISCFALCSRFECKLIIKNSTQGVKVMKMALFILITVNATQCCVLQISYKMIVIPAQAGDQCKDAWISACAGMTGGQYSSLLNIILEKTSGTQQWA
jgi:hypothetical protein